MNSLFASTARGLEELLKTELEGLGATDCQVVQGGVHFQGDTRLLYQSLMWSRLASRIMLPLGECRVYSDLDLYLGVQAIPWTEMFNPGATFAVHFSGLNDEIRNSQYGALKGMAMPVIFFPFSFLATLSTLLLPEITEAHVQNRRAALEHLVNRVMLITLVLSFLAGGLFTQFAKEIGLVLYQSEEIGFYLSILGPLMPFMYMESMVDGILKGLGEQLSSFRYTALDSVVRIALIYLLLPRFGMQGFLFVMLVSNLLTSLLNLHRLLHVTGLRVQWLRWVIKPVFSLKA